MKLHKLFAPNALGRNYEDFQSPFILLLIVLVLVASDITPVIATPVLTFNEATGGRGSNSDQSVGWQFNVVSSITVTDLGWFDEGRNGLSVAHTVGIWNPVGGLLVSAMVPAGTLAPLDGQFRSVLVAPTTLTVGSGYIVGGENFSSSSDPLACGTAGSCDGPLDQVVDPRLGFVNATFSTLGSGFARPSLFSSAHEGFYGPSFSVSDIIPEPSTWLLLGSGLAGLAAWRRKKSA